MKKLLFVNACIRDCSRTEELCRQYLKKFESEYVIDEIKVSDSDIRPLNAASLSKRDSDAAHGNLDSQDYRLARQFAGADFIVIAAPYWDCLFPSVLKVYLEHVCVAGITFAYSEDGGTVKTCRADKMTYITTCGGFLPGHSALESLIRELGRLFSIDDVRFYAAQGLDIYPEKIPQILKQTLEKTEADSAL